jgi:dTDP-L-rhamnose 4-epimerase
MTLSSASPRRILITGGAGFIGSRLALRLVARGHFVRVLDTLAPQVHGDAPQRSRLFRAIESDVDFRHGSVCDADAVRAALVDVDCVVHLAAETGTGQSMYAIRHYSDVNVGGTAVLLDVIANNSVPVSRVVVASSRAVYGEGAYRCERDGIVYPSARRVEQMTAGIFDVHCPTCHRIAQMVPTTENSPVHPHSVYGVTKLAQEQLVLAVGQSLGISAIAFRYQNVYGPGQSLLNPYTGMLSIFSTRIRNQNEINVFEDGLESRDFVYIDDVVSATQAAIEHEGPLVATLNVGSGVATTVGTIATTLQRLFGQVVPTRVSGQFRLGDVRHNVSDLTRVHDTLGFVPSVDIDEGLRRFVAWVTGESVQTDRYEASLHELRVRGLLR